ncbi:MAG: DUF362 domain-containing protein [Actinobacteria bacterium]|nr:DUF362 domain-containing protein [Actinomycetota bacterium]
MSSGLKRLRACCFGFDGDPSTAVRQAMQFIGWQDIIAKDARVAIKPNLTYAHYKQGVTTSPQVLRSLLEMLKERTANIKIVETDGGYGAWKLADAYHGHSYDKIAADLGVELVNLMQEPSEQISFDARGRTYQLPLPRLLLHETDVFITMPVPKVHAMTYLSLSYKNQWGCVPDLMRLRRHYIFNDAIVAINRALRTRICLGDGTYFLDDNGPMEGQPIRMNSIIGANSTGAFALYTSQMMGLDWNKAPHLRRAVALGDMPDDLSMIDMNIHPHKLRRHKFRLRRTMWNRFILLPFRSKILTTIGYDSAFGRFLHKIKYAIKPPTERQ